LVFTFEDIASLIVDPSGIEPVILLRLEFGRLPCCLVVVPDDALEGRGEEDDLFAVCAWAELSNRNACNHYCCQRQNEQQIMAACHNLYLRHL
jgi:hypothetical protein